MKFFMTKGFCAVAIAAAYLTLASCSSDEPTGKDDGDVTLLNGTRLVKWGIYDFNYDSNGRFVSVKEHNWDGSPEVTIDYDNGKVIFENGDSGDIEFNESGYISALRTSDTYKNEEDGYDATKVSSCTISYDGNGHILNTKRIDDYTEYRSGSAWTSRRTDNTKYIWEGDKLISIEWSYSIIDNGQEEREQDECTVNISYSSIPNSSRQYPYAIDDELVIHGYTEMLSMVGLFGKGPAYLPETISVKWDDYCDTDTWEYTLNSDGTIATETRVYSADYKETYNYTYEKGK